MLAGRRGLAPDLRPRRLLPHSGEESSATAPDAVRMRRATPAPASHGPRWQSAQAGFTLIELLVVIIVIGILTGIAIPSYLQYQGRARDGATQANVRAAIPSIELYFSDNATYVGISPRRAGGDLRCGPRARSLSRPRRC